MQLYFSGVNSALPHIETGRLRPIAVTSTNRSKPLPDVPTVSETPQFKDYEATVPTGMWVPAGTSAAIVAKLRAALIQVLNNPKVRQTLEADGSEVIANTPGQMHTMITSEMVKLAKVIQVANIKAEKATTRDVRVAALGPRFAPAAPGGESR